MATTRSHPATLAGLAAVAAGTTLVSLLTWQGFTESFGDTLGPVVLIAALVAGSGALARWWRVPRPLVVLIQVVLVGMVLSTYLAGSPVPVGEAWDRFALAFTDAVETANSFAPPVPTEAPPVHPLLIAGGAVCLLLTDLLACTLRRVPLAGLPLLTVYSVPVSMTGDGPHWVLFLITAIGFLAMIFLSESEQVARWGPILAEDHGGSEPRALSVATWPRTGARAIGGMATALAVVVPLLIPTFSVHLFDFGPGEGGDDDISIQNPMVDLRRDLIRGADNPMLTITTDDPDPSYLRIAVLSRFSENEWSSGDREVPTTQTADGTMPGLIGVSNTLPRDSYDYSLEATDDLRSNWLPTTTNISSINAPGDWRFDTSTMDFLASEDDLDTAELSWDLTSVDLRYDATRMATAGPVGALVSRDFTTLPTGMDPMIRQLTQQVTADAPSRFEKARALQEFFRGGNRFTYTTDVDLRTGEDDLVRFLSDEPGGREGYCEQFAAAMAVMARELGIPARVAVGFLRPEQTGADTFVYSAHDLHAWPELFFPGSGWVRFEPTPADRAADTPGYTTQPITIPQDDLTATASDEESAANPAQDTARPDVADDTETATDADGSDSGFPWLQVALVLAVLLLLAVVALGPRTVRRRRRDARGLLGPEEAWQELRDTALDLRLPWPTHRSPWQTREALVSLFGAPEDDPDERPRRGPDTNPDAVFALDRLVHALERLRYARPDATEDGTYRAEMQACVEALYAGATRRARRTADWWPRSVFRRPAPIRSTAPDAPEPALAGRVVDRVG